MVTYKTRRVRQVGALKLRVDGGIPIFQEKGLPMPNELRIVIIEDVTTVTRGGEEEHIIERRYQLAFGGRVICPELNDKNLLEVLFGMFMFAVTDHPEVSFFLFYIHAIQRR